MPYNELRKDDLLNRWVVIAKERSRRPTDFVRTKQLTSKTATCPLCVGNENMTPPAVLLYQKEKGEIKRRKDPSRGDRSKEWLIRCIPNLYPAFTPPVEVSDKKGIFEKNNYGKAIGHHEVLVESSNHDEHPADAELSQLELVIGAYVDRFKELNTKTYTKYISIFRNFGLEAGASLSHAHSQIIATPMVPTIVREEQKASRSYYQKNGRCFFCDTIEQELKSNRLILDNEDFIVFCPYASINPIEFWILPKNHSSNIQDLTRKEVKNFAKTLKTSLRALKNLLNDPPYNYGIHLSCDANLQKSYHWHLEVYPKLTTWAGFEKSTGIYINTVTPEAAADSLRNALIL